MSPTVPPAPYAGTAPAVTGRALLTYFDEATGERVELTAGELGDWAARSAALMRDGCGLRAGDRVAVLLPPHWQSAAVLRGAWASGLIVAFRPWATAGFTDDADGPFDAVFVSRQRLRSPLETVPAARHPFVVDTGPHPAGEPPAGYRDFLAEACARSTEPPVYETVGAGQAASPDGTTYEQWRVIAEGIALELGLAAGDRLAVDVAVEEQPVKWLLAPLSVGASVLLCANTDADAFAERIAAEGVTHVLG